MANENQTDLFELYYGYEPPQAPEAASYGSYVESSQDHTLLVHIDKNVYNKVLLIFE